MMDMLESCVSIGGNFLCGGLEVAAEEWLVTGGKVYLDRLAFKSVLQLNFGMILALAGNFNLT